jgi:YVTN family beta-propeller protein
MKNPHLRRLLTAAFALALVAGASPARAAGSGYTLAQYLVDHALNDHPELVVMGMHVKAPDAADNTMIASNLDRIGKKSDEDDLKVFRSNEPAGEPSKGRYEVLIPQRDSEGATIGALSVVFMWDEGSDTSGFVTAATAIRDAIAMKTPSLAALFGPAPADDLLLHPKNVLEIPGATGKFDFLEVDGPRDRLLAAHEKDGTADFFNLKTDELLARVKTGPAVHVAVDPQTGTYYVSASDEKKIVIVDGSTFKVLGEIPTEGELDALVFDPKNRHLYITNDESTHVWAIDVATNKVVATIDIPGAPEYMIYDRKADRFYLNIKATNEIVVIDPNANKLVAHWPVAPAIQPHGLAFDPKTGRLFSAGANGKLAIVETKSGRVIGSANIATGVDQAVFDPFTKRIYCASGYLLSVVQETANGAMLLGDVLASPTAKNVAIDPHTHRVWTTFTVGKNSYAKSWAP